MVETRLSEKQPENSQSKQKEPDKNKNGENINEKSNHESKKRKLVTKKNLQLKKKKITNNESMIIAKVYSYHDGNWSEIAKDKKIIELKKDFKQIQNHVEYLRKKKNQIISPNNGLKERDKIIESIHNTMSNCSQSELDETDLFHHNEESEDDEEFGDHTNTELQKNLKDIDEVDRGLLCESISSNNLEEPSYFDTFSSRINMNKKIRNSKIRQKEKERKDIMNSIRDQRSEIKDSNDMKILMMQLMIQSHQQQQQMFSMYMLKMMEGKDKKNDEEKN